jgi:hypothetical protein
MYQLATFLVVTMFVRLELFDLAMTFLAYIGFVRSVNRLAVLSFESESNMRLAANMRLVANMRLAANTRLAVCKQESNMKESHMRPMGLHMRLCQMSLD